jgi:hypothetical protein
MTCLKCLSQYVGETLRPLKKRMYEHMRTINNFGQTGIQATPVSEHFNIICKRPPKYMFQIIETIRGDPKLEATMTHRRKRETFWILTLRTLEPFGINVHV